jgi:uncharacterized protein involved in outer membrane biogenesis
VKKVSKAILIALGILFVMVAVVVLGVNLYIQSAGTQARIQRVLGRALHTPVKIASLSFMPWTGLRLTGITGQDDAGDNILQISKVSARIPLWELVSRKVVVKELSVDGVKVTWNETPEGKWRLPLQTPDAGSETPGEPATAAPEATPAQTPAPVQPQPPAAVEAVAPPQAAAKPFPVKINRFVLRGASFDFRDKNRKSIVTAEGINMLSSYPTAEAVNGSAFVYQISVQNLFFIRGCQTDFSYSPEDLSLFNTRCEIAGGASVGSLNVKTAEPESPFNFDTKFSGIQVERLLADAGIHAVEATGALGGFLHLQGNLRDSMAATGKGQLVITNGHVAEWDLFRQIGMVLHSDKLQQFDVDEARADYHLANGKVFVDEVALKASDLSLTGQGPIDLTDGAISLKCRLTIGGNITRQIPEFLMENFGRDDVAHTRFVDFDVYGTVSKPKTNLLKLIGNNIEHGAKNIFKSLFGRKPKPQFVPPPAPSPVSTPEPAPASTPAAPIAPAAATGSPIP